MVETVSGTAWCAEVLQSRAAGATSRAHVAAVAALAAAADRCRDLVAVTDDQQRILVSNLSSYLPPICILMLYVAFCDFTLVVCSFKS